MLEGKAGSEKPKGFLGQLWDERDAERGIALGLIVGTLLAAIFTTSDYLALYADWILNRNPYGVLWTWINPFFWTNDLYKLYTTALLLLSEGGMWFVFVRRGKLSKFLFYLGWLQNVIWMRGSVFQNITVTMLSPLGALYPQLIIPFMLLQKLPLGWSWDLSDAHWNCAFNGVQHLNGTNTITNYNGLPLVLCPGSDIRWNLQYSWVWSYLMIVTWIILPLLWWWKSKGKHGKLGKFLNHYLPYRAGWWESYDWGRITVAQYAAWHDVYPWFCSLCNEDMLPKDENGLWFNGEFLCWECSLTPHDDVQAMLFRSGLWE